MVLSKLARISWLTTATWRNQKLEKDLRCGSRAAAGLALIIFR
jgi:hypothetical protein